MWSKVLWLIPALVAIWLVGRLVFQEEFSVPENFPILENEELDPEPTTEVVEKEPELATFGSGCFWCTEAVFQRVKGVKSVQSGYSGGTIENPTYDQVAGGDSGHAEVVQVTFDPEVISYPQLLEIFWRSHDPTTPNRQGHDYGSHYRSVIFYHSEKQRQLAERYKKKIDEAHVYKAPVVTEIARYRAFFKAEDEHQNFYAENSRQPYCRAVITPKLNKLKKVFGDKLKSDGE